MGIFRRKTNTETVELTVSNVTVVRVLVLVIISFIGFAALQHAAHALTLIFTALFLAVALNRPVMWIAGHLPGRRKGNRSLAVATGFVIVVLFLAGFVASLAPPLVNQTKNFINAAPELVEQVRSENSDLGRFVRRYNLEETTEKISGELSDRLHNASGTAVSGITKVSSSLFATLTVLVLTYMMLLEGPRWMALMRRLTPDDQESHVEELLSEMYKVVTGFVNGQVLLAAIAAVLILVPLFIFNVSYPLALMVVVFICGLIPMVGHTIGAIIVSTVALFTSPISAVGVLVYYIVYQQIENYAVQPKIQANSTNMSPLLVFSSVVVGVSFGGLLGGLVAIPVAGCIRIILLDYLEARGLLAPEEAVKPTAKSTTSA
ncbi:AI-2E family transporter [Candidatus Saccharibacteria bacterium]|nr:AI-2E family transporter [Candidatus Saccharibacteria bacterium]